MCPKQLKTSSISHSAIFTTNNQVQQVLADSTDNMPADCLRANSVGPMTTTRYRQVLASAFESREVNTFQ